MVAAIMGQCSPRYSIREMRERTVAQRNPGPRDGRLPTLAHRWRRQDPRPQALSLIIVDPARMERQVAPARHPLHANGNDRPFRDLHRCQLLVARA
jgi:hypothetical protein